MVAIAKKHLIYQICLVFMISFGVDIGTRVFSPHIIKGVMTWVRVF